MTTLSNLLTEGFAGNHCFFMDAEGRERKLTGLSQKPDNKVRAHSYYRKYGESFHTVEEYDGNTDVITIPYDSE